MNDPTDTNDAGDQELMSRVKGRDSAAFETLLVRYESRIRGRLMQLVHDEATAADLLQEVFLRLWTKEIRNGIVARTDYASDDLGPQLIAVKSGARGTLAQLGALLGPSVVVDINDKRVHVSSGHLDGRDPASFFTAIAGCRRTMARATLSWKEMESERLDVCAPRGFSVLSRAMRSRHPGMIFAQAAATGEIDALADRDARLFVGLAPIGIPQGA